MSITATERDEAATEEDGFRARVGAFLATHAPRRDGEGTSYESRAARSEAAGLERARAYQAALYDAGLAALTWPKEFGGQGLPSRYQTVFNEESADYDQPVSPFIIGFGMCIPTVLAHGTEAHKQRFVRPAARGEEIWCQLFSEPSAGSDVASLRSTAVATSEPTTLRDSWHQTSHHVPRVDKRCIGCIPKPI